MKIFILGISKKQRGVLRENQRAFQAAIAVIANRKLGREIGIYDERKNPIGIYREGGGVLVNGHMLAIRKNHVVDSGKWPYVTTEEEGVTVEAIDEIMALFKKQGAAALKPYEGMFPLHTPLLPQPLTEALSCSV